MPETEQMPKKKPAKKSAAHRMEMVAFRCTPEFKAHLEQIAERETRTPTQVLERSLEAYAKANGYEPFPKR